MASNTASSVAATAVPSSPDRAPAQRTQASSTCGMASCSAFDSTTLRGSQSSRNVSALAGLTRSGRPKSRSQPYSTMWSAHRLAACRSDRSSASSEARNSATSMARRSLRHSCPAAGGVDGRCDRHGLLARLACGEDRRQRADPGPDERVIGGERGADRGVRGCLGRGQRGRQDPARLRRIDLHERRPGGAAVPAVVEQLAHLRGHPAVAGQAAGVVVDDHDQRVLLLAGVAEDADDLVAVAVGVGVDVALGGLDGAHVLGPGRPGDALVHQREGGVLGLDGLARRAQAGDARQQR